MKPDPQSWTSVSPEHRAYLPLVKLLRAEEQIKGLHSECMAFVEQKKTSAFVREIQPQAGKEFIRFIAPKTKPMWSVLIGEILHNCRSSLDNLVWALVLHDGVRKPVEGLTGFPICATEEDFKDGRAGKCKLVGLTDEHVAGIQRLQPYRYGCKRGSAFHSDLYVLNKLWNIDKHRAVHLCVSHAHLQGVHIHRQGGRGGFVYEARKLENGASVALTEAGPEGEVHMGTHMSMQISFDETAAGRAGEDVIETLWSLHGAAFRVARELHDMFGEAQAPSG